MSLWEKVSWLALGGFLALLAYELGRSVAMLLSGIG